MSQMHQIRFQRLSVRASVRSFVRPSVRFKLHLRDWRTDGRTDSLSVRPSLRWSLTLRQNGKIELDPIWNEQINGNGELTETENVIFLRKLRSSHGILTDERNSYVLLQRTTEIRQRRNGYVIIRDAGNHALEQPATVPSVLPLLDYGMEQSTSRCCHFTVAGNFQETAKTLFSHTTDDHRLCHMPL